MKYVISLLFLMSFANSADELSSRSITVSEGDFSYIFSWIENVRDLCVIQKVPLGTEKIEHVKFVGIKESYKIIVGDVSVDRGIVVMIRNKSVIQFDKDNSNAIYEKVNGINEENSPQRSYSLLSVIHKVGANQALHQSP